MEGNVNPKQTTSLGDSPYPAVDMLPAFRIRNFRPTGHHGVVRMKRHEYDELLTRQPRAALRYVDESDGEVILVGSAFELDQRLREPVETSNQATASKIVETSEVANKNLHMFDVDKDQPIVEEWRKLDHRTIMEGQKAKELFFGRPAQPPQPPAKDKGNEKEKTPATVRFGEVTPPRNSLKSSSSFTSDNAHASRWASYSSLPGSLAKDSVPLVPSETPVKIPMKLKSKSTNDLRLGLESSQPSEPLPVPSASSDPAPPIHVRSSTLQVPATAQQQNEHQPLVDMFYSEKGEAKPEPKPMITAEQPKEWQPLLELFENQLAELTGASAESSARTNEEIPKGPFAQKSGEILTQSIQSLLNGVSLLAAAFKKTNAELQQQIALAQQDMPNNIDKALKASVAAIDTLRSMIPTSKAEEQTVNQTADASAPAAERTSDSQAQSEARDAAKAKTLSNRYKLQRHLLQPRQNQTDADLQQISDLFEDLELQTVTDYITGDVLVHSKIHKVMKRISRSNKVPGNEKYNFKQRASDLAQAWMSILEKYRAAAQISKATGNPATASAGQGESSSSPREMTAKRPVKPEEVEPWILDRVETVTEQMRQELLAMGLLPPPGRSANSFYTRADVLEAYVLKFKELKNTVDRQSSKPTVSDAATSTRVDPKPSASKGGTVKDDNPLNLEDPFLDQNTNPDQAGGDVLDSFDFDSFLKSETSLPGNEGAPVSDQVSRPASDITHKPKETAGYAVDAFDINGFLKARGPNAPDASNNGASSWDATSKKKSNRSPLRHRQSWHPVSTTSMPHSRYPYPFETPGFSPASAMERYPPVSQIDWQKPRVNSAVPLSSKGSTASKLPAKPKLQPMEPRKIYEPIRNQFPWTGRTPAAPAFDSQAEKGQHGANIPNLTLPPKERAGEQDAEVKQNMQNCINQLVEMGFIRGKAEAVTHATLGDIEMALDILNEDSAAWKEKAQSDERLERVGVPDNVPGSWGSWDDELYG